ncbi:hypothetical protein LQZ19_12955 [Treponema primitia]|uniref:hypothetical protein n=1 Tax=Treponema primitia TaxID=88058 RepID=UPI00397E9BDA
MLQTAKIAENGSRLTAHGSYYTLANRRHVKYPTHKFPLLKKNQTAKKYLREQVLFSCTSCFAGKILQISAIGNAPVVGIGVGPITKALSAYAVRHSKFVGGTVSGNTAELIGGGVFVQSDNAGASTFTMSGAASTAISGNEAAYGGGVGILKGSFSKTGGAITGNTAASPTAAVFVLVNEDLDGTVGYRDTNAGVGDNITVTWDGSSYTAISGVNLP